MVRYGRVVRTYLNAKGSPVADVCDDISGSVVQGCTFVMPGGGSSGASVYFPPVGGGAEDTPAYRDRPRVVYTVVGNSRRNAVILGVLMHPEAKKRFAENANVAVAVEDVHPETLSPQDCFIENGGAFFLVSDEGNIVLSAADGQPVRVQLSKDSSSKLRISKGDDASEALLLANRTLAYLTTQVDRINSMLTTLQSLEAAMTSFHLAVAAQEKLAAPPFISPQMLGLFTTLWPTAQSLLAPLDAPTDDLVSSSVAIADESIADGDLPEVL